MMPGFEDHALSSTGCKLPVPELEDLVVEGGHVDMIVGHEKGTADLLIYAPFYLTTVSGLL